MVSRPLSPDKVNAIGVYSLLIKTIKACLAPLVGRVRSTQRYWLSLVVCRQMRVFCRNRH